MAHSKKSIIGADPLKSWKEISNVPVTRKDKEWYLHVLPGKVKEITIKSDIKPVSAKLLQTNQPIKFRKNGNILIFDLPKALNGVDDVIVGLPGKKFQKFNSFFV